MVFHDTSYNGDCQPKLKKNLYKFPTYIIHRTSHTTHHTLTLSLSISSLYISLLPSHRGRVVVLKICCSWMVNGCILATNCFHCGVWTACSLSWVMRGQRLGFCTKSSVFISIVLIGSTPMFPFDLVSAG